MLLCFFSFFIFLCILESNIHNSLVNRKSQTELEQKVNQLFGTNACHLTAALGNYNSNKGHTTHKSLIYQRVLCVPTELENKQWFAVIKFIYNLFDVFLQHVK